MRLPVSPILLWLGLALALVCALPFGLSWYQIEVSRDRLIDQTQRTHLLAARTAAQRLDARLRNLAGLLRTIGNFETLYLDPGSEAARSLVRSAVESEPGLLGLFLVAAREDQPPQLVFGARAPSLPEALTVLVDPESAPALELEAVGRRVLLLASEATARPGVWLRAVFEDPSLPTILQPEELGAAAEVFLVRSDSGATLLAPPGLAQVPAGELALLAAEGVWSAAEQVDWEDIGPAVTAFARVPDTPYAVLSRQPLRQAETLSAELRRSAGSIFAAVAALALAILTLVARKVVRPIRRLVAEQRALAGMDQAREPARGEIAELGDVFEALKRHVNDRELLSQVFIDRYQVLRRIGRGGMGSVYLGLDPRLHRFVALKTLNFDMLDGPDREAAFRQLREEAVVAAALAHRNIVAIHDIIEGDQGAFIAMELVDGESLAAILFRVGALSIEQLMPIAVAVLQGLDIAHRRGMVHRDIKPANILIGRNGDIKVTDFGTAAPMAVGRKSRAAVVGTPGYIAPESIIDGSFSTASDIFAVAVVLIECYTGRCPFEGRSAQQILMRTMSREVAFDTGPLSRLDGEIASLLQAMMSRSPEARPSATQALEKLLAAWQKPVVWDEDWFDISTVLQPEKETGERTTRNLTQPLAAGRADGPGPGPDSAPGEPACR